MNERTHSEDGVSRRQTLTAVTGATVAGLAGVPTAVVGDSGREKRITTLATGSQSQETVTVSKRWYQHKERAIRVKEALSRRHLGEGSVHSVGIETDDRSVGGLRGKRVRVAAAPDGDVSALDAVPSAVEGIPVRTVEAERPRRTDCYTSSPDDEDGDGTDEIHGGRAMIGLKYPGTTDEESVEGGTLCCRVFKGGEKYTLGCRHVISGGACSEVDVTTGSYGWGRFSDSGDTVYLGDVAESYPEFDAALLTSRLTYDDISPWIVDEPNTDIVGRVTGSGIDALQSGTAGTVYKRGRKTCDTFGAIEEARISYYRGCGWRPLFEEGQVRVSADQKQGDSGGPTYIYRGGYDYADGFYVLSIATRSSSGNAQGTSAQKMYRSAGITFGPYKYY